MKRIQILHIISSK